MRRCGFEVIDAVADTLSERCRESNAWKADLHVPIHTNAFNGKVSGTRILCYALSGEGYKAARAVYKALSPITPGLSENVSAAPNLYEVKNTLAPCVYIEADFHDVPEVAKWILEHTGDIGEAICKGICDYYDVPYEEAGEGAIYRVQVGAFRQEENAKSMAKKLEAAGFPTMIVKVKQ